MVDRPVVRLFLLASKSLNIADSTIVMVDFKQKTRRVKVIPITLEQKCRIES